MQPMIEKLIKELKPGDELTPEMVSSIQSKVIKEVNETLSELEVEPIADPAAKIKLEYKPR